MSLDNVTLAPTSPPPFFGHVTAWSLQLLYVFTLYFLVTVVCCLVFFIGRHRRMQVRTESDSETQALVGLDDSVSGAPSPQGPKNVFLFVWHLMRLSGTRLEVLCGPDAGHYLRFHRSVLLVLGIATFFGLAVLLPIYLSGSGIVVVDENVTAVNPFDQTTASNLGVGDPKLWVTVVSVLLNSCLCWVLALWMLRVQADGPRAKVLSVKDFTVHVRNFPKDVLDEVLLSDFFEEVLQLKPEICVISPDLEVLHTVHRQVKQTLAELERVRVYNTRNAPSRATKWVLGTGRLDAERYYEAEKEQLQQSLAVQKRVTAGTGHAFVTFGHLSCVPKALAFFASRMLPERIAAAPEKYVSLKAALWEVVAAPNPRDLVHKNLATGRLNRWIRAAAINVFLAVGMIFFTTPVSLIGVLSQITQQANLLAVLSSKLASVFSFFGDADTVYGFVASSLMVLFTFLIPRALTLAARAEKHHTRSHTEMSVVRKIFAYLFLCIIVMPAIFMTSVDALFKIALSENGGWKILDDLGGIFPRAIFFVNYLMAIGLVSNFFELLNFPGVLVAWYRRRHALTTYDRRLARKAAKAKFQLGYEYAYQMVLLSMTLLFSSVVPVLLPFAFFAFLTKHFVDRNNLVYVFTRPHTNTKIVRIVLTQVIVGLSFYQMVMFCFFLFGKEDQTKAIVIGMTMVVSVVVGMYVRFWTVRSRGLRFDFEEEGASASKAMLAHSYRDRILQHDVVQDFYRISNYSSSSFLPEDEITTTNE